ncbi:MAG TPA: VanZ family protein [Candidatus Eremiobacteraeota bacterium]|nr:MAG: VanZ like family protein [bacterium ADurb.Bin363]HPZ09823.1 VanZ family protein [Candidatus Eremiobacteraeota bacterium]
MKFLLLSGEKYKVPWRLITISYAIFIFIMCTTGIENLPRSIFFWSYIDIIYHFVGFCIFSIFLRISFYGYDRNKSLELTILCGLIWAFICEILQIFIPTRSFTIADLLANWMGIIFAQLLINIKNKFSKVK